jgi:hypothetical protein
MMKIKSIETKKFNITLFRMDGSDEKYCVEIIDRNGRSFEDNLDYRTASAYFDRQVVLLEGH